jgi:signal transduction histidine kinase
VGVFAVDKKGQAANITTAELELMRDVAVVLSVRFGPLLQAELDTNRRAPSLDVVLPEPNESNGHPHKRDELFQSALHDLKAPMQSILGFAELLQLGRGGALTPEQAEYVSRIVGGGDELLELIDRLLTINDLEAGRLDGSIEQIIAPRLVDSVVDRLQGKALRAHVCIACDIAADLPPLRGDWLQLGAVFQNLIANAIDAAKPGDLVRITGTHSTDGYARFAVTQMSSGSSEPPPLPFDPDWSRKGSSRRRSHGLGLAIVTRVVETYGGEVWAEGDLGAHFSIGFTLPLISAPMLRIARRA